MISNDNAIESMLSSLQNLVEKGLVTSEGAGDAYDEVLEAIEKGRKICPVVLEEKDPGYPAKKIPVGIYLASDGIEIRPEGYGDCGTEKGFGCPIFIEFYEGSLRVVLWTDINDEDPTVIHMEGALESLWVEKDKRYPLQG
jgi:hypothetical protein